MIELFDSLRSNSKRCERRVAFCSRVLLRCSFSAVLETRVNTTSLNDFARQSHCITWKLVPPWPKRSQTEFSLGYSGNCAIAVFANLESRDACSPLDRETNIPYRIFFSFFSLLIFFSLRSNRIVATRVTRGGGGSWPELKKFRATITRSVGRSVFLLLLLLLLRACCFNRFRENPDEIISLLLSNFALVKTQKKICFPRRGEKE